MKIFLRVSVTLHLCLLLEAEKRPYVIVTFVVLVVFSITGIMIINIIITSCCSNKRSRNNSNYY